MRTVLFDLLHAQPEGCAKYTGGGEYIKTVFKKLVEEYADSIKLVCFYNQEAFVDEWVKELITKYRIEVLNIKKMNELAYLNFDKGIDVYFSGLAFQTREKYVGNKTIYRGVIHGMRRLECPGDRYQMKYFDMENLSMREVVFFLLSRCKTGRKLIKRMYLRKMINCMSVFDEIVVPSEHTLYEFDNFLRLDGKPINVFYSPSKVVMPRLNELPYKNYILLVSAGRWEKNSFRALLALEDMYKRKKILGVKTVLVGNTNEKIKKRFKNVEDIIFLDYVSGEDLENLYMNCLFLLYPTLNEGFGYPPVEAMRYGKTCVVSAVCSLPEIYGDAVYYVNPYDLFEIQNRILQAIALPIPTHKVKEKYMQIFERQEKDLEKLCEWIAS